MALKLCLHGVNIARPEIFTEDVARRLKLTVKQGKLREKKYGENLSARFRRNKLQGSWSTQSFSVRTLEGIVLVNSHLSDLRDVEFRYEPGSESQVLAVVQQLLSGADLFVVAEPDLELRVQAMAGKPYPPVSGDDGRLKVMQRYLEWQVYGISWFWLLLHNDPANRMLVRQLRVRIRRLRSCFVFFREGLPEEPAMRWQQSFREEAELLSNLRELDVALLACQRWHDAVGDAADSSGSLLRLLQGLRQGEQDKFLTALSLNAHTEKLAEFLLWLAAVRYAVPKKAAREKAQHYVDRQIAAWGEKLLSINNKYPDFSDMDDLHKVRIKVKRFRYVTQTVDLVNLPPDLLRQLKQLQDVFGLLHDDYVNAVWARGISLQHPGEEKLQKQIQSYIGWQSARSESSLALVSEMWENFSLMLKEKLK